MFEFNGTPDENLKKAIEACRTLIKTLSNPYMQPLEREAGYTLAKALLMQVESLGLMDDPEIKQLSLLQKRLHPPVRRFPQDFFKD